MSKTTEKPKNILEAFGGFYNGRGLGT